MPYKKLSEARIKKLDGVDLTLSQVNAIVAQADAIGGDFGWPTAISKFKKSHSIKGDAWVESAEKKEVQDVYIEKEADGRWKITTVSTADVKDLVGETFDKASIDYDAKLAETTGEYPEYRLFHKEALAVGKVTKMGRSGIFAVDEGYAYDDPFSQAVAANMLAKNDGKWRCSRGFYVLEAKGGCPKCGEQLVLHKEHMLFGFKCPTCKSVQLKYKGTLSDLRFLKTKTFDITITDQPCMPWSGVGAVRESTNVEVKEMMDKTVLKQKLLDAGLQEADIDSRLKDVTDAQLKEYDGIPDAKLFKELGVEEAEEEESAAGTEEQQPSSEEQTFVLDESVLKEFSRIVDERLTERLNGLTLDIGDPEISFKELPEFQQLQKDVVEIKEMLASLVKTDVQKLKELNAETPRNGQLRVMRFKSKAKKVDPAADDEEDAADSGDDEEAEGEMPMKRKKEFVVIKGGDGKTAKTMTDFVLGGAK
jgi:hypothetical protein